MFFVKFGYRKSKVHIFKFKRFPRIYKYIYSKLNIGSKNGSAVWVGDDLFRQSTRGQSPWQRPKTQRVQSSCRHIVTFVKAKPRRRAPHLRGQPMNTIHSWYDIIVLNYIYIYITISLSFFDIILLWLLLFLHYCYIFCKTCNMELHRITIYIITSCDRYHDINHMHNMPIWPSCWHMLWHSFWRSIWYTFGRSIWHPFWHSICHVFWESSRYCFWQSIWHIFWHNYDT